MYSFEITSAGMVLEVACVTPDSKGSTVYIAIAPFLTVVVV